jgi:hypothetical protein
VPKDANGFVGCLPKDRGFTHQVRALLRSVWDEDHVNAWLLREQHELGGVTVVAAIAADRYTDVTALVVAVLADYVVRVPALDPPSPLRSIAERMPA